MTNQDLPNIFYADLARHLPQRMTLFRQKAEKTADALSEIFENPGEYIIMHFIGGLWHALIWLFKITSALLIHFCFYLDRNYMTSIPGLVPLIFMSFLCFFVRKSLDFSELAQWVSLNYRYHLNEGFIRMLTCFRTHSCSVCQYSLWWFGDLESSVSFHSLHYKLIGLVLCSRNKNIKSNQKQYFSSTLS